MAIDLYQMPGSAPCHAVIMAATYLDIELNFKLVNLMEGDHFKPDFVKINPQHSIPTINDRGFVLWESRAIMTYLANKYAPENKVYPKDPQQRAVVDRMLYFDLGTLYRTEAEVVYPHIFNGEPPSEEKVKNFKTSLKILDSLLEQAPYTAGDHITLADFSIFASVVFAEVIDYNFAPFPRVQAWLERMKKELPYYKEVSEEPLNSFKKWLAQQKD